MTRHSHHRWSVGLIGTLLLVSVGLLYGSPATVPLAIVPLGYVVYGALSSYPDPTVEIERSLSPAAPTPGSTVEVTLTVTNAGDRTLPDVRAVDGVPAELAVVEGSPRGALAVPAGASRTLTYAVMGKRGDYEFDDPAVRMRSLSGSRIVTTTVEPDGERTVSCSAAVDRSPVQRTARSRTGTLPTDSGGPGLEFHSTREYQPGDPSSRIDWRRLAKTDELSTINFREERAARLLVIVDARPPNRIVPRPGYPTGAGLAAYAGERAYEALTAAGHQVGVAALGLADADLDTIHTGGAMPWVDPPSEGGSVAAARGLFDAVAETADEATTAPDPALRMSGSTGPDVGERLLARLPPDAQVLLVTPLVDDEPVALTGTLRTHGVPVTVLSPDVTPADSPGGRVSGIRRRNDVATLRLRGVTVVDWSLSEPLATALEASLPEVIP